jgi:hypothetical protein
VRISILARPMVLRPDTLSQTDQREEWRDLDQRIVAFDDEFAARAKADEAAIGLHPAF